MRGAFSAKAGIHLASPCCPIFRGLFYTQGAPLLRHSRECGNPSCFSMLSPLRGFFHIQGLQGGALVLHFASRRPNYVSTHVRMYMSRQVANSPEISRPLTEIVQHLRLPCLPCLQICLCLDHRELHSHCSVLIQRISSILSSFTYILDEPMRAIE